jgi:tricorn protease
VLVLRSWRDPYYSGAGKCTEGRLLIFPDIFKDKIAFVYGGDLWLASSAGGSAHRITSNPGRELFPKFSPDGRWLAFTGQYDGNFNVYVMSSAGGQPKQLTFYQGRRSRSPNVWVCSIR